MGEANHTAWEGAHTKDFTISLLTVVLPEMSAYHTVGN